MYILGEIVKKEHLYYDSNIADTKANPDLLISNICKSKAFVTRTRLQNLEITF